MSVGKKSFYLRASARFFDYCLLFLILGAVSLFLPLFYDPLFYALVALLIPFIWAPLEAIFLSRWGTTFGKRLFGMKVCDGEGKKLSFFSALKWSLFLRKSGGQLGCEEISLKRKCSAILLTGACFFIGLFGNALTQWGTGIDQGFHVDGWVQFESEKADFKIYFPTDPKQESKQLVIPSTGKVLDYEEISHEEEKVVYSVTHMNIPKKWKMAGSATLLKLSLEAIIKHSAQAELLEKQFLMHQGERALDYKLKQEGNEVRGRLIVIGNTMYRMTITYPSSHSHLVKETPFFDSFERSIEAS